MPRDHVHRIPSASAMRAARYSPAKIQKAIGATGTKKVAVILCEFLGTGLGTSGSISIQNLSGINDKLNKMVSFYTEASGGQLTLNFTVIPTTHIATYSMSYYGYPDSLGNEKGDDLIREAISAAGITKGTGAGQYDAAMVIHAGYGNESTNPETYPGDIWSAVYTFANVNGFTEGLTVPEFEAGTGYSPLGVWCHEMGHQLGLPDIYATDGRSSPSIVGEWCLMDYGVWAGNGNSPPHPSAWCKQILGWFTPVDVSGKVDLSISPTESTPNCVRIQIPTAPDPTKEYFLLEYRSASAGTYDAALKASGVLIWHVDEAAIYEQVVYNGATATRFDHNIINNEYEVDHMTMELVEADSTDPSTNMGDTTDPWPGAKNTFTEPDSNSFNGAVSGVSVAGFTFSGGKANFSATRIASTADQEIAKALNYPNPAGPDYPVGSKKPQGTLTTLVCHLSKPPREMEAVIYTISGEKVMKIQRNDFSFKSAPSDDYKWVYEYDWNGKNDGGDSVAPGVYIYRITADSEIKTGKLAITR